jgi:hypothetical protein
MASSKDKNKKDVQSSLGDLPWAGLYFFVIGPVLFFSGADALDDGEDIDLYFFFLFSVWFGILMWRTDVKKKVRDREKVKKIARERARERRQERRRKAEEDARALEAEKARLEKEALENAQKPKLSALEAATLALDLVEAMSLKELNPVIKILKNPREIEEVLQNANNDWISRYREKIEALYASRDIMQGDPLYDIQLATDLERCMSLGMNAIRDNLGLEDDATNTSGGAKKKKIERVSSWKEIKKDLK